MSDEQSGVEYTPEQLAAAQQLVEYDRARKAADLSKKRAAYLAAVRDLTGTSEWASMRDGLNRIITSVESDGLFSFQVNALSEIMVRLDKMITASQPAA